MLMVRRGTTGGLGSPQGVFGRRGAAFYGTRVCPGWYQGSAGVTRGCMLPFLILRMLILRRRLAVGRLRGSCGAAQGA